MGSQDDRPAPAEGSGEQGWDLRVETCRISLWRGYLVSAFYARATGDSTGASIGEPSSAFRWRRSAAPDTQEARLAQYELASRLKADGWTQTGQGDQWYETDFARPVLVPSHRPAGGSPHGEAAPLPEREPDPAVPPVRSAPPQPAPPGPAAAPPATHPDPWRAVARAGLVTAIALLGWVAAHPSIVGA
ncbi:MAG: hypothetical protein ACRDL2_11330 [Gaiellaceae bacterium]